MRRQFITAFFLGLVGLAACQTAPPPEKKLGSSVFPGTATALGDLPTYTTSVTQSVFVAAATDVFCVNGSASKTIVVVRFDFGCTTTATTAQAMNISLHTHSAANTGSTPVTTNGVPHDLSDPTSSGTYTKYTVTNPTIGGDVGPVRQAYASCQGQGASAVDNGIPVLWDFGVDAAKAIVLRGVAQQFCLNFNGATLLAGLQATWAVTWTEQ
jgi:hypothetical protein